MPEPARLAVLHPQPELGQLQFSHLSTTIDFADARDIDDGEPLLGEQQTGNGRLGLAVQGVDQLVISNAPSLDQNPAAH
jgi:hypothetical protein